MRALLCPIFLVLALLGAAPRARAEAVDGPAHHLSVDLDRGARRLATDEVHTARFRIRYSPAARGAAEQLAKDVEQARADVVRVLGTDWPGVTEIRMGVRRDELDALAAPRPLPAWASAVTFPGENLVLLDAVNFLGVQGPATLRHELSHVALGQFGGPWPRWFSEGLAQQVTHEHFFLDEYTTLFRAVHQERLFSFDALDQGWPELPSDVQIAYAQSDAFVEHLLATGGPGALEQLCRGVQRGEPFNTAFAKAFHTTVELEERHWRAVLPRRYAWLPTQTTGDLLWGFMAALSVAAFFRRQTAKRAKLAELDAQMHAEEAAARLLALTQDASLLEEHTDTEDAEADPSPANAQPLPSESSELSQPSELSEPSDLSGPPFEPSRRERPAELPPSKRVLH